MSLSNVLLTSKYFEVLFIIKYAIRMSIILFYMCIYTFLTSSSLLFFNNLSKFTSINKIQYLLFMNNNKYNEKGERQKMS